MTISSRERNMVLIGLVAVLLFLGLQYLVFPLMDQQKTINDHIEVKASLLQQYQTRLHMLPRLEQELAERHAQLEEAEQRLITGLTPALGAARVQLILDDLAGQQKGIEIKSTRVLDSEEHGSYTEIALRVALTTHTNVLTGFLYDIEHQPTHLSVSTLTIRVPNPKKPRDLRVDMVIEAFMTLSSEEDALPTLGPETHTKSGTA